MRNPFAVYEPRFPVLAESKILLSTMTLQTAINLAATRMKNYRESGAAINFQFYNEVHEYLESLAINN